MTCYPKWIYHATNEARIVQTPEEHASYGAAWTESPADCVVPVSAPASVSAVPADAESIAAPKKRTKKGTQS